MDSRQGKIANCLNFSFLLAFFRVFYDVASTTVQVLAIVAKSLTLVSRVSLSVRSARRIVATPRDVFAASSCALQRMSARAALI